MKTVLCTLGMILFIITALHSCSAHRVATTSPAAEPSKPACYDQSETCLDAWYESGDLTGDYGPVDAAE